MAPRYAALDTTPKAPPWRNLPCRGFHRPRGLRYTEHVNRRQIQARPGTPARADSLPSCAFSSQPDQTQPSELTRCRCLSVPAGHTTLAHAAMGKPGCGMDYLGPRSQVSRAGLPSAALYSCRFGCCLGRSGSTCCRDSPSPAGGNSQFNQLSAHVAVEAVPRNHRLALQVPALADSDVSPRR
jgi:hypothetical protein